MLLTAARWAARTDAGGSIVPLAGQRRELWDSAAIAEGLALIARALGTVSIGPYQLQAAIAAVHDEAGPPARRTGRRSPHCTKCSPRWRRTGGHP